MIKQFKNDLLPGTIDIRNMHCTNKCTLYCTIRCECSNSYS
jgi:hypothetical protein